MNYKTHPLRGFQPQSPLSGHIFIAIIKAFVFIDQTWSFICLWIVLLNPKFYLNPIRYMFMETQTSKLMKELCHANILESIILMHFEIVTWDVFFLSVLQDGAGLQGQPEFWFYPTWPCSRLDWLGYSRYQHLWVGPVIECFVQFDALF